MERFDQLSPRARARITGVVYLIYFVSAIVGAIFLQQAGITALSPNSGDAKTLADNVLGHQAALQTGVAIGLISTVLYVAITTLFYQLFKPVSGTVALLALAFGLIAMAVSASGILFQLAPLVVLKSSPSAFTTEQVQALAQTLLKWGDQVGSVSLIFSGFFQMGFGYLMFKSRFLPRIFGVLIALAGFGYMAFLAPPLVSTFLRPIEVLGFLGEFPLMLWLLIMGINSDRWTDRARETKFVGVAG